MNVLHSKYSRIVKDSYIDNHGNCLPLIDIQIPSRYIEFELPLDKHSKPNAKYNIHVLINDEHIGEVKFAYNHFVNHLPVLKSITLNLAKIREYHTTTQYNFIIKSSKQILWGYNQKFADMHHLKQLQNQSNTLSQRMHDLSHKQKLLKHKISNE